MIQKIKDKIMYCMQWCVEKITRKSCNNCKYCIDGIQCSNFKRYEQCVSSIYPHGYEAK